MSTAWREKRADLLAAERAVLGREDLVTRLETAQTGRRERIGGREEARVPRLHERGDEGALVARRVLDVAGRSASARERPLDSLDEPLARVATGGADHDTFDL